MSGVTPLEIPIFKPSERGKQDLLLLTSLQVHGMIRWFHIPVRPACRTSGSIRFSSLMCDMPRQVNLLSWYKPGCADDTTYRNFDLLTGNWNWVIRQPLFSLSPILGLGSKIPDALHHSIELHIVS